ncbi:hypothetical protein ACFL5F_06040 [Planctomycetota bacterium]
MKRFNTILVRMGLLACVAVITIIGVYSAKYPYLDSCLGSLYKTDFVRQGKQVNLKLQCTKNSQDWRVSSGRKLVCPLPDGWQVDWNGGKLWLTHYNPNGSVADSLPFDSLINFYQWFETHPDCCDVNIDKLTSDKSESEETDKQVD